MRKILGFSVLFLLVVVGVVLLVLWKTGVLFKSSSVAGNSVKTIQGDGGVNVPDIFKGQSLLG